MASATVEAPVKESEKAAKPKDITKANYGRVFEVLCAQLGPWELGHAFSEHEFRRLNPAPAPMEGEEEVKPEDYWEAMLDRLLKPSKELIQEPCDSTTPGAVKTGESTEGGIWMHARPVKGPAIKEVFNVKPMETPLGGPLSKPPKIPPMPAGQKRAIREVAAELLSSLTAK